MLVFIGKRSPIKYISKRIVHAILFFKIVTGRGLEPLLCYAPHLKSFALTKFVFTLTLSVRD